MNKLKSAITAFSLLTALLIAGFPTVASAEIETVAEAINKSGRQRMLTQRIVRAYSQIGLNVKKSDSEKMLADAVKLFDKQLAELEAFALTPKLKNRVKEVQKQWPQFKKTATGKVDKKGASKLQDTNDKLLKVCHELVLEFQSFAGTKSGKLINIAGRQRMLSQRNSMFFMLKEWGLGNAGTDKDMKKAFTEFRDAMATMKESPINTPKISQALKSAYKHFDQFETMLGLTGVGARIKVSEKADFLLTYMNRITGMYQEVADSQ